MRQFILDRRTAIVAALSCAACSPSTSTNPAPPKPPARWDRAWALVESNGRYAGIGNDEGFLAIARMGIVQALLLRFKTTGESRWLDFASEHLEEALRFRASTTGAVDYRNRSLDAWLYYTATRKTVYVVYHAANIARHLVDYAQLVRSSDPAKADRFAQAALATMQACESDYDADIGAYRWPLDFPTDEPFAHGRIVSSNGNLLAAFAWLRLGEYFGKADFTDRFSRYLKYFRSGGLDPRYPEQPIPGLETRQGEAGTYYFWLYDPYVPADHHVPEDILHVSWSLEPILHDATSTRFAFSAEDLPVLARTLRRFIVDPATSPPRMMFRMDDLSTIDRSDAVAFYRAFARLPHLPGLAPHVDAETRQVAETLLDEMLDDPKLVGTAESARVNYFNSPAFLLNYVAWADVAPSAL